MDRPRKRGTCNLRWRRDMSEFLLTFLVDEAKKGVKVDKIFKKQAFEAAVKAVNDRFDVEVSQGNIENHLKTIKAKHATVKRLMSLPDTTFDPEKKQINMDAEALRKHLKMHPSDDLFLNKTIDFFDEMSVICGDDFSSHSGRFAKSIMDDIALDVDVKCYSSGAQTLALPYGNSNEGTTTMIADDNGCIHLSTENANIGGENHSFNDGSDDINPYEADHNLIENDAYTSYRRDSERPRKRGTPNIRWRRDMSQFLLASLAELAKSGLKFDKFFKKEAYVTAARAVNDKFDAQVTEANVENHLRTVKTKYAAIRRLLDTPGILFDPVLKQINMEPEAVKRHLKVYPNDDLFLNKPIELFEEMTIICGECPVTRARTRGTINNREPDVDHSMDDDNIDVESTQLRDHQYPAPSVSAATERTGCRKRSRDSELLVLRDIASNICDLVSAIKSSLNKDFANELYGEVMQFEGFEEEELGIAFDYLMEHEMRARSFLAKSPSLRRSWLKRHIRGPRR